jgi:predicted P-loop ATPase
MLGDATRGNKGTRAVTVAVVDIDHKSPERVLQAVAGLAGHAYVLHSSHSHRVISDADCCLRLVMPLSRDVLSEEWPQVHAAIVDALDLPADPSCKDRARLYFLPSVDVARQAGFVYERGHGDPIDVELALQHARNVVNLRPAAQLVDFADLDVSDVPEPVGVDLSSLRDRLRKVRDRKARKGDDRWALLDKVVKGKPFCCAGDDERSDKELEAAGVVRGRQVGVHRTASLVAFCLPAGTPTGAVLELLRPCLERTECEPEGLGAWLDSAASSYETAMAVRISRDLERKRMDDILKLTMHKVAAQPDAVRRVAAQVEGHLESGQGEPPPTIDAALTNWRDLLLYKKNPEGVPTGALRQVGENAYTIIALDEALRGTLAFDVVEKRVIVQGGPFAGADESVLDTEVADWLCRHYDLNLSETSVGHRILRVAHANKVDPLRDYLESVTWDGTDRLGTFLETYAAASTRSRQGGDITSYVRDVGRKTMIGAVARALDPGCQLDTCLVLEGPEQGEGKSSFCRILGGEWYLETALTLGDKDSMQLVATAWLVELGEGAAARKTEVRQLRSFLTKESDKFRPAYGRVPVKYPRRAFFVMTTNDDEYLIMRERRFWPVACGDIDREGLRRDRDQLWAQAVVLYRRYLAERDRGVVAADNPYKWWYEKRERHLADAQVDERVEASHAEAKIAEWWAKLAARPDKITSTEVAETVLKYTTDRVTRGVQTEIGLAMLRLGFSKRRAGRTYYYEPDDRLRAVPCTAPPMPAHLQLVGGNK